MYIFLYIYIHTHIYLYMYMYICIYTHTQTHTHTHTHTHTYNIAFHLWRVWHSLECERKKFRIVEIIVKENTGWPRWIRCLKLQVFFPQKMPRIIGLFCGKWRKRIKHTMLLQSMYENTKRRRFVFHISCPSGLYFLTTRNLEWFLERGWRMFDSAGTKNQKIRGTNDFTERKTGNFWRMGSHWQETSNVKMMIAFIDILGK